MTNLLFFKHVDQAYDSDDYLDEGAPEHRFGSSFSYYESIHEFNQSRYSGASYSVFQLGRHLLKLMFGCQCCRSQTRHNE